MWHHPIRLHRLLVLRSRTPLRTATNHSMGRSREPCRSMSSTTGTNSSFRQDSQGRSRTGTRSSANVAGCSLPHAVHRTNGLRSDFSVSDIVSVPAWSFAGSSPTERGRANDPTARTGPGFGRRPVREHDPKDRSRWGSNRALSSHGLVMTDGFPIHGGHRRPDRDCQDMWVER